MQKIGKTNRNGSGILSVAVAILLCTTLLTGHVISGTMAKYVTQGTADSGSARVASFSVAATGDNASLSLSVGGTVTYTITLNNQSEVAVKPIVSVTFTSDISNYLVVKLNNHEASSVSADGKTLRTIPFGTTERYVKRVKKVQRIYAALYEL